VVSELDRRLLLDRIGRYYWLVFVSLVIIGTAGGYFAYSAYTATETVTEERVTSTATTFSEFNHSATVREDVGVFGQGVELENRRLYFTSLSPSLNGSYTVRHGGGDPEPASARIELRLVLRSVGGGGVVYWKESERLASANESSLGPGEPLSASFSVNVTRSLGRIEEVRESIGASPGSAEVLVRADSVVEGTVGEERFIDTRSEEMSISPGRGTYSASSDTEGRKVHEAKETVVREKDTSGGALYIGILLFVGSIAGFVTLERKREQGVFSVPEEELQAARLRTERENFDEWISEGSIEATSDRQEVRLSSLTDLVDTAIDTDSRVIETEEGERYVVLTQGAKYVYERAWDTEEGARTDEDI
jgi:hypothetical protein